MCISMYNIYVTCIYDGHYITTDENESWLRFGQFTTCGLNLTLCWFSWAQFYQNTGMLIYLRIICGCCRAVTAELIMACRVRPVLEKFVTSDLAINHMESTEPHSPETLYFCIFKYFILYMLFFLICDY